MELNPHNWHKRPADSGKEEPCTVCGCPRGGNLQGWNVAPGDTGKRRVFLPLSFFASQAVEGGNIREPLPALRPRGLCES